MPFKLPKLNIKGTNIKEGMQRKYGTGDYARGGKKFEQRMKPGESKFQYDVRMRKEARKVKQRAIGGEIVPTSDLTNMSPRTTYQEPDPSTEITGLTGRPSYENPARERNPGDLRAQLSWSNTTLPSAPGDDFIYDFDEKGNIAYKDTSEGEDAEWQFPKLGSKDDRAIRKRYTGSETGDLSNWYGHDTYTSGSYWDKDPVSGEMIEETFTSGSDWKKSYLPYDLAQKHYNPNYKGSKK